MMHSIVFIVVRFDRLVAFTVAHHSRVYNIFYRGFSCFGSFSCYWLEALDMIPLELADASRVSSFQASEPAIHLY